MVKAVIFGCSGTILTDSEKSFFERVQPLGFILFERNCQTPVQLKNLVTSLKECVGRGDVRILMDQEGGRISRLPGNYWRVPPKASLFGDLYENDPDTAYQAAYSNALLIASDLNALGINVNCAPLADVPFLGAHPVISDRAFSSYVDVTAALCVAVIQGLQHMGITPVLKHFPGHGRAMVDSHEKLPVIKTSKQDLFDSDFDCFKQVLATLHQTLCAEPWGMTAHAVYTAIDDYYPATFSSKVIDNIIRGAMDFQGFLVSDCLTMNALHGPMMERVRYAIEAGCDAVLHCNGDFSEMLDVASVVPELSDESVERLSDSVPQKIYDMVDIVELEANLKKAMTLSENAPLLKRN